MTSRTEIVNLLKNNDRAVARALVVLTERQTADEQVSENTKYHNNRGFRPCHARMGTSMAKFFKARGYLSPKQVAYWRKPMAGGKMRIEIYAGQLLEIAKAKAAAKKIAAGSYAGVAAARDGLVRVNGEFEHPNPEVVMQRMEVEQDREQTRLEELNKFLAKCRMEG